MALGLWGFWLALGLGWGLELEEELRGVELELGPLLDRPGVCLDLGRLGARSRRRRRRVPGAGLGVGLGLGIGLGLGLGLNSDSAPGVGVGAGVGVG